MIEDNHALIALSLVVIASGCASNPPPETSSSASISIENFSVYPQQVFSDQQATIQMTLVNDGEATAEDVSARIFNVPFESTSEDDSSAWSLSGSNTVSFGSLEPADPENNIPAREATETWNLQAPDLSSGVTIPYQFISNIRYKYSTQGTSSITLMSQQRYREEGASASRPVLDNTAGPIQLQIRTRSPIVFYPEDEGSRETEMCVVVRNQGDGTPFLHNSETYDSSSGEYSVGEEETNQVKLRVPDQGNVQFSSESGSNTAVVELFGNRGIGCFTINVDNWGSGIGPQQEVPIVMTAEYGYSKETDTSATVQGRE